MQVCRSKRKNQSIEARRWCLRKNTKTNTANIVKCYGRVSAYLTKAGLLNASVNSWVFNALDLKSNMIFQRGSDPEDDQNFYVY